MDKWQSAVLYFFLIGFVLCSQATRMTNLFWISSIVFDWLQIKNDENDDDRDGRNLAFFDRQRHGPSSLSETHLPFERVLKPFVMKIFLQQFIATPIMG